MVGWMFQVDVYLRVRRAVMVKGMSIQGPPGLSVADAEATEGTDETMTFTVSLNRPALGTVTVNYEAVEDAATADNDYTAASGILTFTVGQRTKTVSVPIINDTPDEPDETFTLELSDPSGAYIVDGTATGTIMDP